MKLEPDHVFEFTKLVNEHVNLLGKIVAGMVVVQIFMIAHVLVATRLTFRRSVVSWILFLSAAANVGSLAVGYFAEGANLWALKEFMTTEKWEPSWVVGAEYLNLAQMGFLFVAGVLFLIAFFSYSRILAEALIKTGKPPKGGDHGD